MHQKIYSKPEAEAMHREGLLGDHFDCLLTWLDGQGYSLETMRCRILRVTHFGRYLEQKGVRSIHELEGAPGQKLLSDYQRYWKAKGHYHRNSDLRFYIRALEEAGVLKASPPTDSPMSHEIQTYVTFLRDQKGLSESTILSHVRCIEKFLEFLDCQKYAHTIPGFGITEVDNFIKHVGTRLRRTSQKSVAGILRSFVRFLYQSGEISRNLSYLITSPRCYQLEALPRLLNWDEVEQILQSVDVSVGSGVRAYAILTLLATYGLRAGEVAHLRLEDIDWRRESIHIARRKNGRDLRLPLVPQAAEAVIGYLKRRRPSSNYREVFLLTRAPWTPLDRQHIAYVVRRQIHLTGLAPSRHGAHIIRHSFATHLHCKGASLKEIGDMLGHKNPQSTRVYTKTAIDNLREAALEVPEVPDE